MKTYIVYVNGEKVGTMKVASHNAAEKKAQKVYGSAPTRATDTLGMLLGTHATANVTVEYTEELGPNTWRIGVGSLQAWRNGLNHKNFEGSSGPEDDSKGKRIIQCSTKTFVSLETGCMFIPRLIERFSIT